MSLLELTWTYLNPFGFTLTHLNSLGLAWIRLTSTEFICRHLNFLAGFVVFFVGFLGSLAGFLGFLAGLLADKWLKFARFGTR
jgi:hypothetical protein